MPTRVLFSNGPNHIAGNLYLPSDYFDQAVARLAAFYEQHLKA